MLYEVITRNTKIGPLQYHAARERLILSRATHLDQLADKLQDPRVHGVISAILSGEVSPEKLSEQISPDDQRYRITSYNVCYTKLLRSSIYTKGLKLSCMQVPNPWLTFCILICSM